MDEYDAAARESLTPDVPDGMDDFCIRPGKKLPESKPVDYHQLSAPYVACALCTKTVDGTALPNGWVWLPDARVCCAECNDGPEAQSVRARAKYRRARR